MSLHQWFSVACNGCDSLAPQAVAPTAREARLNARDEHQWIYRPNPDGKGMLDLCPTCQKDPKYHRHFDAAKERAKFDAAIDLWGGADSKEGAYWLYLRTLFDEAMLQRPAAQPFSYFAPMFDEEFS